MKLIKIMFRKYISIFVLIFLFLGRIGWAHETPPSVCPICGMKMPCPMKCLYLDGTEADKKIMVMSGIPLWLFFLGVGLILIVSFISVEWLNRKGGNVKPSFRFNILNVFNLRSLIKKPGFRFFFQIPVFLLFCLIVYAGIFGHKTVNIATVLTWTIWWAGLIFLILFLGKAWCFVCPWDFVATLAQHLSFFGFRKEPRTFGLKWPKWLKNIYLATGLFVVLTWFELGFKITSSPYQTAMLAIFIIALSIIPAFLFEKRSFCKYGCFVGRISGLYSMFSPIEIRSADPEVCAKCTTKDCYTGNEKGAPCPTSLTVPQITENTYCLLCTECVKTCPHDNVALNVRPFATDLRHFRRIKPDESWLAIILLVLTSFHGLTMTSIWDSKTHPSVIGTIKNILSVGDLTAFTIAMIGVNGGLVLIYYGLCRITKYVVKDPAVSVKQIFLYFAYSLLPIALFYHLAHNSMHFLMEGQKVIPLFSDPLGNGKNYFGMASKVLGPILSADVIWYMQVAFVVIGHVYGIIIAHYVSRKLFADEKKALASLVPMLICMIFYSFFSLWIMQLNMNMRSTLM